MACYRLSHRTTYRYDETVSSSLSLLRLVPRHGGRQRVLEHIVEIDPAPAARSMHLDCYGNAVETVSVLSPHQRLSVHASGLIEVSPSEAPAPGSGPAWEDAANRLGLDGDAIEFRYESPLVPILGEAAAFARQDFTPGRPLLDAALALTRRIHAEFAYDGNATTISTPLSQVLIQKRGVCQDFAQALIGCLRALGLCARYVSGYFETDPPPGAERLVGADATHAWASLRVPGLGWVDLDPTNGCIPTGRHLTLAWGRDFRDVSPMRGVVLGGGANRVEVAVDLCRISPGR